MNKVLIVDASETDYRLMSGLLTRAGYEPITVGSMEAAKEEVAKLPPGAVVVTAMKFAHGTAQELISWQKLEGYKFPVIAVVDNLNAVDLLSVMRDGGAVDVVQRAAIDKQLVETVGRYARHENAVLVLDDSLIPRKSDTFRRIEETVKTIAATNANVIVFGESGTGKEQIARQIYLNSSRTESPCIVLDAGSAALVGNHNPKSEQSEIYNRIKGYFGKCAGGTIIIKNVHLLNFDKQSVMRHILETEHPNVRVIGTADPDLLGMVTAKTFRPNLYYILRQAEIVMPPLRETIEDIEPLANYFLGEYSQKIGMEKKKLNLSAIKALRTYPWPGNVRELKDVILFAAFHTKEDTITKEDISFFQSEPEVPDVLTLKNEDIEKKQIAKALERSNGNMSEAARLLKISRSTLSYKLRFYGFRRNSD